MSTTEHYQQCRLSRGETERVAWIPVRGAKPGAVVELGGRGGELWTVTRVYNSVTQSKADLDERDRQTRRATPSVKVVRA